MSALMKGTRLALRLPLFVMFLVICLVSVLLIRLLDLCRHRPVNRTPLARIYLAGLCRLLGLRIRVRGTPASSTALLVSNHISWLDIAVLGGAIPVRFLAKREVARWPLIGWLAQDIGTLFIQRGGGQSAQVREQIAQALYQDQKVLIFPEGTTSNGQQVLPFHGRLLQAAADADRPIQAVTLAYMRKGVTDPVVPFIGEDSFQVHLIKLLANPPAQVELIFHPPLLPSPAASNDQLADILHLQVARGLTELLAESVPKELQHPAPKPGGHSPGWCSAHHGNNPPGSRS